MFRNLFSSSFQKKTISSKKILMVGAGGLGCELSKFFDKMEFKSLHIVDLDVIELSNLNRQFYFRKEHIWEPKAKVLIKILSNNQGIIW